MAEVFGGQDKWITFFKNDLHWQGIYIYINGGLNHISRT